MAKMQHRLDEDCVEYFLFPRLPTVKSGCSEKEVLEDLRISYRAHLSSYLNEYIWQKGQFTLNVVDKTGGVIPPHLHGVTNFGCNIDDEWFVVFLLMELTKSFPDLIVRVIDSDGEILLIEMADQIPKWLNPDSAENRVYMYQGSVHIVPAKSKSIPLPPLTNGAISLCDAMTVIREYSSVTKCDIKMQRCLSQRIGRFPDKIYENHHHTNVFVPAAVASLLNEAPWFLSAAVNAFIERDAVDSKACSIMKFFPPETRVVTRVKFTRCLYAQLLQHKYDPDRRIGWKMPTPNSSLFKEYDLGMKLACGFEILVQSGKRRSLDSSDESSDPRWLRYLSTLKEKGFFRGEIEGSKLYCELKRKARQYFVHDFCSSTSVGEQILSVLDSIQVDLEELQRREKSLPSADDDSWLDVSCEDLENILREKWGYQDNSNITSTIPSALNSFVNHQSSVDGVEAPKLRERRNRGDKKNSSNRVTLDPDSFSDAMNSILDFKVPEWEEGSSSDFSEYSDEDDNDDTLEGLTNGKPKKVVNKLKDYMESMDRELSKTPVGQSFERKETLEEPSNAELDHYSPVDVDLTALCNILESYRCQPGTTGPATTLMNSMGVQLPPDNDDADE